MGKVCRGRWVAAVLAGIALPASAAEPFPVIRPAHRVQAAATLTAGSRLPVPCLTPILESSLAEPDGGGPAARRALQLLLGPGFLPFERRLVEPDGTVVRFTVHRAAMDRLDAADADANGRPDVIDRVLEGVGLARAALVEEIGLASPDPIEILIGRVGSGLDGFLVPAGGQDGRPLLVLDPQTADRHAGTPAAAAHQYAHAVALSTGSGVPAAWAEALASWTTARVGGGPDTAALALLAGRAASLHEGLDSDSLELAAGNALWFDFIAEAYGPRALRLAVEALGGGSTPAAAFDWALRQMGEAGFDAAFREFHLWTLLTGDRSTGLHFAFADRLPSPAFVSEGYGLPLLSVGGDPLVAGLGGAAMRLRVDGARAGGVKVRFEGEATARWEADLLLAREDGALHRVPLALADGRGEVVVPLEALQEAMLLVRNLDRDAASPRAGFSWSASEVRGYPFEPVALEASWEPRGRGVSVRWETRAEQGLLGYNVVRYTSGGAGVRVTPVWMPALGDEATPAAYEFLDATAVPGVAYTYAVEGITASGLTASSEAVPVGARVPRR